MSSAFKIVFEKAVFAFPVAGCPTACESGFEQTPAGMLGSWMAKAGAAGTAKATAAITPRMSFLMGVASLIRGALCTSKGALRTVTNPADAVTGLTMQRERDAASAPVLEGNRSRPPSEGRGDDLA